MLFKLPTLTFAALSAFSLTASALPTGASTASTIVQRDYPTGTLLEPTSGSNFTIGDVVQVRYKVIDQGSTVKTSSLRVTLSTWARSPQGADLPTSNFTFAEYLAAPNGASEISAYVRIPRGVIATDISTEFTYMDVYETQEGSAASPDPLASGVQIRLSQS